MLNAQQMCYTLRGSVVILYATVRAALPPAPIAVLCSLRRSAYKVIVAYRHCKRRFLVKSVTV